MYAHEDTLSVLQRNPGHQWYAIVCFLFANAVCL